MKKIFIATVISLMLFVGASPTTVFADSNGHDKSGHRQKDNKDGKKHHTKNNRNGDKHHHKHNKKRPPSHCRQKNKSNC